MTQKHVFDFKEFPALETDRLKLWDMLPSDVTALLRHFGNPEVVRFIDMQPIKTIDQANEWLRWMGGFFAARDGLRWGIILKGDDCSEPLFPASRMRAPPDTRHRSQYCPTRPHAVCKEALRRIAMTAGRLREDCGVALGQVGSPLQRILCRLGLSL